MHMNILCVYMCDTCKQCPWSLKVDIGHPKIEVTMVVSSHVGAWNQTLALYKTSKCF